MTIQGAGERQSLLPIRRGEYGIARVCQRLGKKIPKHGIIIDKDDGLPLDPGTVEPAEALRALCALRQNLPEGAAVTVPLTWLSAALEGTTAVPTQPASADLTVADLCTRFGRKPSAVRAWLERGDFPGAFKLKGRDWRVPLAALEAFEAA